MNNKPPKNPEKSPQDHDLSNLRTDPKYRKMLQLSKIASRCFQTCVVHFEDGEVLPEERECLKSCALKLRSYFTRVDLRELKLRSLLREKPL